VRIVIDPYLSDSLAEKYCGTPRPHIRMMQPPVAPSDIPHVVYVCCTHAHTDHMDPGTLPALMAANSSTGLIAPRAMREQALIRSGLADDRLILVDAGETFDLAPGLALTPTRSAHETLERDDQGNHRFLGYGLTTPSVTLWHSGDGIPFDGLTAEVAALNPDITLMPVNGRRPELSNNGVPGNFTLDEAIDVSREVGAAVLIAHHYGLFDFNTLDPDVIDARGRSETHPQLLRARQSIAFQWSAT
jgi:L-ascorbate metabolism protein UlaG (beta-lactamase superfamily)